MFPLPLLAEVVPPAAQLTDNNIAVAVMIFIGGVAVIGNIVSIWAQLRRSPPIEVDMNRIKEEVREEVAADLLQLRGEINTRLTGLSQKLDARTGELQLQIANNNAAAERRVESLYTRMSDKFQEAAEKIGRLRGHVEAQES